MKIVFLDFDGVLNGTETHEPMSDLVDGLFLNVTLVERLNTIIYNTGAHVVLSTSWRYHAGLRLCARALASVGFAGEVIGETPDFRPSGPYADRRAYTPRSDEIRAWLKDHPVDAFVVLDDHGDAEVDGHTVRTDVRVGLTDADVERAVRIVGGVMSAHEQERPNVCMHCGAFVGPESVRHVPTGDQDEVPGPCRMFLPRIGRGA